MALQLPIVTIDDLRQFHAKHFPYTPPPEQYLQFVGEATTKEQYEEENDGLGYYEDGVPRTLTDEQIAMFRHTEIQTILRERRRRLEAGQPLHIEPSPPAPAHVLEDPINREPSPSPSDEGTPMDISSDSDAEKEKAEQVDRPQQKWTAVSAKTKARNAKNRKKNRKNHRLRKKEERKKKEQEMLEEDESDEWDPWHQAHGPDVQKDNTVDLDY